MRVRTAAALYEALLRASHAKPWKDSSDAEHLDVYDGLLLAVHLDALFDRGLLTFAHDGTAPSSPLVPDAVLRVLGFPDGMPPLRRVADGHHSYLAYHREYMWRRS